MFLVLQDGTSGSVSLTSTDIDINALDGTNGTMTFLGEFSVGSAAVAKIHIWLGRKATGNQPQFNVSSGGDDMFCVSHEFNDVNAGSTIASVLENSSAGSTTSGAATNGTVADSDVVTLGVDRLAVNVVGISDDNAIAAFTGMSGGTWAEPVDNFASATGTDASIGIQTAAMASAGTISGGTFTQADATDGWGTVGFALIGTTVASTPGPPNPNRRSSMRALRRRSM